AKVSAGKLRHDPVQALAVEKLQSLHNALIGYQPASGAAGWKARFGLSRRPSRPPQGLYLFGGVGRGKSMLMDIFFRSAAVERKRRVHFHEFMHQVHIRLSEFRQSRGGDGDGGGDPIPLVARRFAGEAWLLCFDELQVHDITDAMIIGRLFEALFEAGVVMVATSNRPPSELYKDGLQRDRFEPFIGLIEDRLDLLELEGPLDYRLESLRSMRSYMMPNSPETDHMLGQFFERLTGGAPTGPDQFEVQGRWIGVPMAADGVALARFEDLCAQPLGAADYLEIARRYHTIVVAQIPRMGEDNMNEAKRFVTLIDALYERRVNLICSADVPPHELYVRGKGAFEFERTASRLIEMQSDAYMAARHLRGLAATT
ncbi:MAG: cell division protein ZapE, partial [Rhodospirillales bacterium]